MVKVTRANLKLSLIISRVFFLDRRFIILVVETLGIKKTSNKTFNLRNKYANTPPTFMAYPYVLQQLISIKLFIKGIKT